MSRDNVSGFSIANIGRPLRTWSLQCRRGHHTKTTRLWLYPELNLSSCVGECESEDGHEQLQYYIDYVRRHQPDYWANDAVLIYWSVCGDDCSETAPCHKDWDNFNSYFHTPVDLKTGEELNWFHLPVINHRFPQFAKALGWLPAPFQTHAPLRSIIGGRP